MALHNVKTLPYGDELQIPSAILRGSFDSLFWFYSLLFYCFRSLIKPFSCCCCCCCRLLFSAKPDKLNVHYLHSTKQLTDKVCHLSW